jgi:hypothetical protein
MRRGKDMKLKGRNYLGDYGMERSNLRERR